MDAVSCFNGSVYLTWIIFNRRMAYVCSFVEQNYRALKQYWCKNDHAQKLKVIEAPISLIYKAFIMLLNFILCFYQNGQTIERFGFEPPSLNVFLADHWYIIIRLFHVHLQNQRDCSSNFHSSLHWFIQWNHKLHIHFFWSCFFIKTFLLLFNSRPIKLYLSSRNPFPSFKDHFSSATTLLSFCSIYLGHLIHAVVYILTLLT